MISGFLRSAVVMGEVFTLLIWVGVALAEFQPEFLPDGSLRPGTRITIRAGQEREFLFRREGVRFLSGRARIVSVGRPFIDPEGREIKEFFIDVDQSAGIPWMHDEKPFRMRIHAETDFTLEARKTWEWTPEDDYRPSQLRSPRAVPSREPLGISTTELTHTALPRPSLRAAEWHHVSPRIDVENPSLILGTVQFRNSTLTALLRKEFGINRRTIRLEHLSRQDNQLPH